MSLRWSQRVLKTSMGGPVCRPYVLKRFPHGGRPQGSPLRRIQKLSLRFVGAGHWPARRGGVPFRGPPSSASHALGTYPYPLCRCATSSLPLWAYGHFPLIGGIGPLTRRVVPSSTGFKKVFRGWVGEALGPPVGNVQHPKKAPSSAPV